MALGTPVAGTVAYSAQNGTSVTPAYPANIAATDSVLLIVGQKPSTANGGTVTTPTDWTLRSEITGAGGYGTTLGADTGNTNLRIYSWDNPVAGQTGNLSVTIGTNNVSWAFMVRIPSGGGTLLYGSATGSRTTAPTAGTAFNVTLTDGSPTTAFKTGDVAVWAMCIPTDVTTPNQFSGHDITATGANFGTPIELNEPDSGTGNDIGGYSAWNNVDSGSSTVAPTITVVAGGTVTNVRGPFALVRVRELSAFSLDAQPASFTITGVDAETLRSYNFDTLSGSFTLTGQDAVLTVGAALQNYEINAESTAFALTGQAATLLRNRSVNAESTAFALTGQAATLLQGYSFSADSTAYSLTGQDATLVYARRLSLDAQPTSYTLTGQAAELDRSLLLQADPTSYTLTGQPADFLFNQLVIAEAGTFVLTGQDALLERDTADPVLDASPAAFTINGQATTLLRARILSADANAFSYAGQPAATTRQRSLVASSTSYGIFGQSAEFTYVRKLVVDAQPTSLTITGQPSESSRTRVVDAQPGLFGLSLWADRQYIDVGYANGLDASLLWVRNFDAEAGEFTITGAPATLQLAAIFPRPEDVRDGVVYGPGGIYVGTYVASGGGGVYLFDD